MSYPKIAGVTRIRNEAHIIQDTLDHYGEFCPAGIYVLDEASTDDTAEIVRTHPDVRQLIEVPTFEADPGKRRAFEGWGRQDPCDQAVAAGAEWILCFDADERIEFDFESFDYANWDAVSFRLFDFYITAEDIDGWDNTAGPHPWVTYPWSTREWIGPEYRDIQMLFRVGNDAPKFYDRVPEMQPSCRVFQAGYEGCVRHYGKAISIRSSASKHRIHSAPAATAWSHGSCRPHPSNARRLPGSASNVGTSINCRTSGWMRTISVVSSVEASSST